MKFALNRLDMTGPKGFAESAVKAETLGWSMGLLPCNPLSVSDPYVCLSFAAEATDTIHLGTLLDTPVIRHPSALAGSIATVARLAPGRIHTGLGVGDTAVRFNGLAPANVQAIEDADVTIHNTHSLITMVRTGKWVTILPQTVARFIPQSTAFRAFSDLPDKRQVYLCVKERPRFQDQIEECSTFILSRKMV